MSLKEADNTTNYGNYVTACKESISSLSVYSKTERSAWSRSLLAGSRIGWYRLVWQGKFVHQLPANSFSFTCANYQVLLWQRMADQHPLCNCGRPASLKQVTDTSKESYGRWFWGCKQFNVDRSSCGFFAWYQGGTPQPGLVTADLQRAADGSYKCLLCGQACVFGDNEHVCRLYGVYQCDCGRSWSSGFTWTGETQQCRTCGAYQRPDSCQQLQRGPVAGAVSGLPHDSAHCSMCQQLGHPCNQVVRQGQPVAATLQQYGGYAGAYY